MAHALIKIVRPAFGFLPVLILPLIFLWVFFGGLFKMFGPHVFGYEHLGWRHSGAKTVRAIGVPKWLGADSLLSPAAAPFRQDKVYLEKGDAIIIEYDVEIIEGGLILSVFRTNFSRLLQGPLVENHQAWRLREGAHRGAFEYVAPRDGFYVFSNQIRWAYGDSAIIPMPDYDLEFEYRWRVRHAETRVAESL